MTAEGKYSIKVGGQTLRQDLVVKNNTFADVYKAAIKWFYYQRASMALESSYAGKWARAAGHTNATVDLHNSTGASGTITSSKGWYDAGDYGRYIVNSGITTYEYSCRWNFAGFARRNQVQFGLDAYYAGQ